MNVPDWIAADWGTTNLRVWGMSSGGAVVSAASSAKGMGKLDPSQYEPALLDLIDSWLAEDAVTLVVACGMEGARQGWVEVPYQPAPCAPFASGQIVFARTRDARLRVAILAGVCQPKQSPDVMRGEETQIAGFLSERPYFEGVVCLPGTHTKWVHIRAGEIVRFQTFMTGELFELLRGHSVLRHSIESTSWDGDEFVRTVAAVYARPESAATRLFGIRAESLLMGLESGAANARLSGILLGAELAAAPSDFSPNQEITIIGTTPQAQIYEAALRATDRRSTIIDGTHVTLAGLKSAHSKILEQLRDA